MMGTIRVEPSHAPRRNSWVLTKAGLRLLRPAAFGRNWIALADAMLTQIPRSPESGLFDLAIG